MYYKFWLSLRKLQTKSQFRHYITIPFFHLLDIRHLRFLLRLHTWFHFSIYSSVIIRNQLWPHLTPGKTIWINLNQSYQRMLPYKFELFKRTGFWEDFLKVFSMYSYVKPPHCGPTLPHDLNKLEPTLHDGALAKVTGFQDDRF